MISICLTNCFSQKQFYSLINIYAYDLKTNKSLPMILEIRDANIGKNICIHATCLFLSIRSMCILHILYILSIKNKKQISNRLNKLKNKISQT
jgi:hypothetical protein